MKRNIFTLALILCGISSNAQAKLALTDPSWNFYHKNGATIYSALMQIRDNEWYEKNIQQILNDNDPIKRRNLLNNSVLEVYFDGSVKAIYNPNLPNEIKNAFIDLAKYIEDNHCIIYRYWHSGNIENNIFSDSTIKSKAEILELLIKYINKNIDSSDFTIDEHSVSY